MPSSPRTTPNTGNTGRVGRCPHCGTAVEGPADAYCCTGCQAAAALIRGAGLEEYYRRREAYAPRPEPLASGWNAVPVLSEPDGSCGVRLQIDGLRCASCVWVTERVLQCTPGVLEATVSYATGRAALRWDPARVRLADLAQRISDLGYRPRLLGEEAATDRGLLLRLGVAAFAAANIMLASASIYVGWWGAMEPRFTALFHWTTLLLATPVALWCAAPFFIGAWAGLRRGLLHMDTPIALAVATLYLHGVLATLRGQDSYLDSLAMLVALLLSARMLEASGRRRSAEAAVSLAATVPRTARRSRAGRLETIPAGDLRPGDEIDVGAGEELAADGMVSEGAGQVRMALLTGEAEPVAVVPGDRVVAGAILADGALTVRVAAAGTDTMVQRMAAELLRSADHAVPTTTADRLAPWFTGLTLLVAAVTFAGWTRFSGVGPAVAHTVAVLVVACPCALALAYPLSAAAGLGAAARRGLLFRSASALLDLERVDIVALDKTGTITLGLPTVVAADDATLRIAAGLERYSHHPIARAIVAEAVRREIPLPRGGGVREEAGVGVSGWVDGRHWDLRSGGPGLVYLATPGTPDAEIRLADAVRGDARDVILALRNQGLRVVLLSGDHASVARRIGAETGVGEVVAGMDPSSKAAWIAARRGEGHQVLFAGDGLNDGAGLAQANVGIAMGQGAASSVLVADGVIASEGLTPLLAGLEAARAAARAIRTSIRRSVVYNIVAVGAAAAGLVNPLVAALLMPLSSGLVIWSAGRVESRVRKARA